MAERTPPDDTTAPVTAEDLRERLIAVIKSVRIHPRLDPIASAMIMAGAGFHVTDDEAAPLADAVLAALAGDPGDLPVRMADAIREAAHDCDDDCEKVGCHPNVIAVTVSDGKIFDVEGTPEALVAAAMSVRWEHAARMAAEVERLRAELDGWRGLFEAANAVAGTRTDERDEAIVRADAQFQTRIEEVAERDALKAEMEVQRAIVAEFDQVATERGAAIERVRALHFPDGQNIRFSAEAAIPPTCPTCLRDYPCPTIAALAVPESNEDAREETGS